MPSAEADDATSSSLATSSEQPQSLSSNSDLPSSIQSTSDTQQALSGSSSQSVSQLQPPFDSISNQLDTAQSTLDAGVSKATSILNSVPGSPDSVQTNSDAMALIQNAGSAIQTAVAAIKDARAAVTTAKNAADVVPIAQSSVDGATVTVQMTQGVLDTATATTAAAQSTINTAQTTVDGATATVALDTTNLAIAQAAADASTVVGTISASGLVAQVYRAANGSSPTLPSDNAVPVLTTVVPSISFNWGSGQLLNSGLYDHVIIKFTGQITADSNMSTIKYAVYSDDGARLYIDGNMVTNNWRDQGLRWSAYSDPIDVSTNKTQDITLWYYENGGGAGVTLGWMVNNAYFTSPTEQNFTHTTIGVTKDPALVAAAQAAQDALAADTDALAIAQAALSAAQDALNNAQSDQATAQANYDAAASQLATAQSVLQVAQATAASTLAAAVAAADTATAAVDTATATATDTANTILQMLTPKPVAPAPQPAPRPQPVPVVPDPQPDPQPQPEPAPVPAPVPTPVPDPVPAPTPQPVPVPDPAPVPSVPVTPVPSPTPAPTPQPPVVVPGLVSNNPDQLSDTTPKEAPAEVLVPHIQEDKAGVENGGIEFFGTKSAPQVVGEDGKLTPPAPPPGSGLPIPPEAITVAATFIGQPGGTTFNAPDVAVPVIETPVTGAIAAVPGVQALNHAFVAMANIGNDMSPVTRKKAKKILVLTTVIAAVRRRFN